MSNVSHPSHYTGGILPGECIDYVKYLDFCRGNVIKYLWRSEEKNGQEDVKKSSQYLDFIIQSPCVIAGSIPREVLDVLNEECTKVLGDYSQRGTQKYDFIYCIYTLANLDTSAGTNDVTLMAQVLQKIIDNHIED